MGGNLGWKLAQVLTRGVRCNISLCIGVWSRGLPIRIQGWLKRKEEVAVFSPVWPIQFLTPPVAAYLSGAHHSRVCERRISSIQLFQERSSEKVHATIPKSIVLVLSSLFFKEIAKMAREAMDLCLRLLQVSNKNKFDSYGVWNSVLIISHITFFPTTFLEIELNFNPGFFSLLLKALCRIIFSILFRVF